MRKKMLFVHAYGVTVVNDEEILDSMMLATISHVAEVYSNYDEIILLGGWHNKELGEFRFLSDVAYEKLVEAGVPKEKMKRFGEFGFGWKYTPCRTTEEEIILVQQLLIKEGLLNKRGLLTEEGKNVEIVPCFVCHFYPKAVWYYERLGIPFKGLELVCVTKSAEDHLKIITAVLKKLEELKGDPSLSSPSTITHLQSRTLGKGYYRPDPILA